MRLVQGRGIKDGSIGACDELVRQVGPVVEGQSRPAVGAVSKPDIVSAQPRRIRRELTCRKLGRTSTEAGS